MKESKSFMVVLSLLVAGVSASGADEKKITFEDHVMPVFRNRCMKCHNANDLKGDLDLSTFSGVLRGAGSGEVVSSGDSAGSKLFNVITHDAEPTMPPNSQPIPKGEIEIIGQWISGGLLETSGSKAIAASKPKIDLTVNVSVGKPEGPPPMPEDLVIEPVLRTDRTTAITGIGTSPWAPLVAVGGQRQVLLYNTDTLELEGILPFPEGFPKDIKFSRNGKLLAVGGGYGAQLGVVAIFNVESGERVITVGDEFDSVLAADISADQRWIALGGPSRLVKVYSTATGELVYSQKKHTDWVTAAEFSPNGKLLATADRGGNVFVWDSATGVNLYSLRGHRGAVVALSWRADSEVLLSASEDRAIKLWNVEDEEEARSWNAHGDGTLFARYSREGNIVSAGRDGNFTVWNGAGARQRNIAALADLPVSADFSHDGKRIIGADWTGNIGVWNTADGKLIGKLNANPPTLAMRLDEAGKSLAKEKAEAEKAAAGVKKLQEQSASIAAERDKHWEASSVAKLTRLSNDAEKLQKQVSAAAGGELQRLKGRSDQASARVATAEKALADLKAQLAKTDKISPEYRAVEKQLTDARARVVEAAKQLDQALKAASDQSIASRKMAEQEAAKFQKMLATTEKTSAKYAELAKLAMEANNKVSEAAKAEGEKLQAIADKSVKTLAAAEQDAAKYAEQLKKTEKANPAYVAIEKKIADSNKSLADLRKAADSAQKQYAALKTASEKSANSLATSQAETGKLIETAKTTDPAFLAYVADGKKLEDVNKQLAAARGEAAKAEKELQIASAEVDRIKAAQFNVEVHIARKELEEKKNELAGAEYAVREQETALVNARQALTKAKDELASIPDQIAGFQNVIKFDQKWVDEAKAAHKKAVEMAAKLKGEVKGLTAKVDEARRDVELADNQVAKAVAMRKEIAALGGKVSDRKEKLQPADQQVKKAGDALKSAKAALAKATEAAKEKPEDEALKKAVEETEKTVKKAQAELAAATKAGNAIREGLASLTKELSSAEKTYAESEGDMAEANLKAAKGQLASLEKELSSTRAKLEAAGKEVPKTEEALKKEMANIESTKKKMAAAEARAKELPPMIEKLSAELKKQEQELAKAKAGKEQLAGEVTAAEGQVEKMAATYRKMKEGPEKILQQAKR